MGKIKISFHLKQKGIDEKLINKIFEEENLENKEEMKEKIENLINKKFNIEELKKDKEKWFAKHKPKIIRFLLSKGFVYENFSDLI